MWISFHDKPQERILPESSSASSGARVARWPSPAKKAPAKAETKATKDGGTTYVYEATGRFGVTNRGSFPHEVAVAADVKDPSHPSARWRGGLITRFFVSEEAAQRCVEKQRESGCDCQIVPAKLIEEKQA